MDNYYLIIGLLITLIGVAYTIKRKIIAIVILAIGITLIIGPSIYKYIWPRYINGNNIKRPIAYRCDATFGNKGLPFQHRDKKVDARKFAEIFSGPAAVTLLLKNYPQPGNDYDCGTINHIIANYSGDRDDKSGESIRRFLDKGLEDDSFCKWMNTAKAAERFKVTCNYRRVDNDYTLHEDLLKDLERYKSEIFLYADIYKKLKQSGKKQITRTFALLSLRACLPAGRPQRGHRSSGITPKASTIS